MSILSALRPSDSPLVETITHGRTLANGATIRPAESNWHMVFVCVQDSTRLLLVGPWSSAGDVSWGADAEILWVKLKLGVFMPHLPTRRLRDSETPLPSANSRAFWLNSAAWQFPNFENIDTFVDKLAHAGVLVRDPLVSTILQGAPHDMAARTVRHRFLHATGLTHTHILQHQRALQAAALLRDGMSILDTVAALDYYDQPHLTHALKRFVGTTPAQLAVSYKTPAASSNTIQVFYK
jgi:hypothetical protein